MQESHYKKYYDQFLDGVILSTKKLLNGEENPSQPRYRFQQMLTPVFSKDGTWTSVLSNYRHVKADIVSFNSPLPLKSRPSVETASGKIPKSGMRKKIEEDELTALQDLEALGLEEPVKDVLFNDPVSCVYGMYENMEYLHLYGLSTGVALVTEEDNVGTATRLTFGYPESNKFGVAYDWADPATSDPLSDIEKVVTASKGSIRILMMDRPTANKLRNSFKVRRDVASSSGAVVIDASLARRPSMAELNEFLTTEYNITIDIVERVVDAEINGDQKELTPWEEGMIIGIPSYNVGDLVYARTAEEGSPVSGVDYKKPEDWMLLSVFREHSPTVSEQTRVQARVFPVITNVSRIYQVDTKNILNPVGYSDSINLNQTWQKVVADVKLNANLGALNQALVDENAKDSPRDSVVTAIEDRIAELGT